MTEQRKKKSRWRKGADRAPTANEKAFIFKGCYEGKGWWRGARVYPVSKS